MVTESVFVCGVIVSRLLVSGVLNGSGKPAEVGGGGGGPGGAEGEELESPDSISQPLQTPPPSEPQRTPVFVDEPLFQEQWYYLNMFCLLGLLYMLALYKISINNLNINIY